MIRFPALIILTFIVPGFLHAQQISLNLRRNFPVAYIGLDNPIECTVEKLSCSNILLLPSTGTITRVGSCQFIFRPSDSGEAKITIWKTTAQQNDSLGERYIIVKELPDPKALVGGSYGGNIMRDAFVAQAGVGTTSESIIEIRSVVTSYSIMALRDTQVLFIHEVKGNAFPLEIRQSFKLLEKGDNVIVYQIDVLLADGRIRRVKPLEFNLD